MLGDVMKNKEQENLTGSDLAELLECIKETKNTVQDKAYVDGHFVEYYTVLCDLEKKVAELYFNAVHLNQTTNK